MLQKKKDVHGKRVGERVEEYAPKHKHSRVGIYSKRISHLIKTSPQLPGGLCHTKRLRVEFGMAPHPKSRCMMGGKRYICTGFLRQFTGHSWSCFFCCGLEIAVVCVHAKGLDLEHVRSWPEKMQKWSTFALLTYHFSLNSFSLTKDGIKDIKVNTDCHILAGCQVGN